MARFGRNARLVSLGTNQFLAVVSRDDRIMRGTFEESPPIPIYNRQPHLFGRSKPG
jgi:hypothetical protein